MMVSTLDEPLKALEELHNRDNARYVLGSAGAWFGLRKAITRDFLQIIKTLRC